MFGTFLIVVITLMQFYVFWRIMIMPLILRHISKKVILATGFVFWLVFVAGRMLGHNSSGAFSVAIEFFGMNWLGIVFILFTCFFIIDVITCFGLILPRLSPYFRGLALAAGLLLSIFALVQGLRPPIIRNYEVYLSGLPKKMDGTILIAVSDLHLGSLLNKYWLAGRVSQINTLNPDIIVLLGDIYEGHGGSQNDFIPILKNLSAPLGIWAVPGNHESHRSPDENVSLIKTAGFVELNNTWKEVQPGFILVGLEDLPQKSLFKTLTGKPAGATILLSHSPLYAEQVANAGVQLMLCGHTHAGQIWPFNYMVEHRYPLIEGRYEIDGMTVIVCRGTGTWGPRMRLWRPSEILRITLRSK